MRGSEIVDVNVVPDTRAIRRLIIISKDGDRIPLAKRDLQDERYQMGFRCMVFTDFTAWIRARGIEVSQSCEANVISVTIIAKNLFDNQFRPAIRIDRYAIVSFMDRNLRRCPINGGGARE